MAYQTGGTVICSITVKNSSGTLINPATSMNIKIDQLIPQFTSKVTSTAMTNDSTGTYHYDCQTAGYLPGKFAVTYTATDGSRITTLLDYFFLE